MSTRWPSNGSIGAATRQGSRLKTRLPANTGASTRESTTLSGIHDRSRKDEIAPTFVVRSTSLINSRLYYALSPVSRFRHAAVSVADGVSRLPASTIHCTHSQANFSTARQLL
eukprot:scaffold187983_cov45-Prasinocladus_malaysianus.AAC.1